MTATVADPMLTGRLRGYRLQRVGSDLWRVTDSRGLAVGHIARSREGAFARYDARRFSAATNAFLSLGSFCRIEDAAAALHDSR